MAASYPPKAIFCLFPPGLDLEPSQAAADPPRASAPGVFSSPSLRAAPIGSFLASFSSLFFLFFSAWALSASLFFDARVTRTSRPSPILTPSNSNPVLASEPLRKSTNAIPLPRFVLRSRTTRTASTEPFSSGYSLLLWNSRMTSSSSTSYGRLPRKSERVWSYATSPPALAPFSFATASLALAEGAAARSTRTWRPSTSRMFMPLHAASTAFSSLNTT